MQLLDLHSNCLRGWLPSFANNTNLKVLLLETNYRISGPLPPLPSSLMTLSVHVNQLDLSDLSPLMNLAKLESLSIHCNNNADSIPTKALEGKEKVQAFIAGVKAKVEAERSG